MIAVENYHAIYFYTTIAVNILLAMLVLVAPNMRDYRALTSSYLLGLSLFFFITILISTRPISYYFGDMGNYYNQFQSYIYSYDGIQGGDILFNSLMYFFAKYLNAELFFFCCGLLYFLPLYIAYKRVFRVYWPIAFILSTIVITFYGFAVNGIRNGIAAHIFLVALTLPRRYSWIMVLIAVGFHSSLMLVAVAYLLTIFNSKVKIYYYLWLGCFIVSIFYSGFGELISGFNFSNDKFDEYLELGDSFSDQFSKTGYRYDFILYGFIPVLISYYYIYKRQFKDNLYNMLVSIYLFSNSFFLLVNKIAFSNRFAYLSWFMMILVLLYPIYKLRTKTDDNILIGLTTILVAINIFFYY